MVGVVGGGGDGMRGKCFASQMLILHGAGLQIPAQRKPHTDDTEARRGRLAATREHREGRRGHGGRADARERTQRAPAAKGKRRREDIEFLRPHTEGTETQRGKERVRRAS